MIVGITKQGIEGVPPIEMLALSQVIQPFLGAAGPRWDVVRVPVEGSTNQVLVILVDPPQVGQPTAKDSRAGASTTGATVRPARQTPMNSIC